MYACSFLLKFEFQQLAHVILMNEGSCTRSDDFIFRLRSPLGVAAQLLVITVQMFCYVESHRNHNFRNFSARMW